MAVAIVCVTALLEISLGRTLTYRNGPVRPWASDVKSDQNSQQISDWYTFSHIIHGALFYGATHVAMPAASLGLRAAVAVAIEATWESYENSQSPTPNNFQLGVGNWESLGVGRWALGVD